MYTTIKAGDGKDVWCGFKALEVRYNSLFDIAGCKEATATELYVQNVRGRSWNLGFL